MVEILTRHNKPNLTYIYNKRNSAYAPIVFLGGFRSDMMGSKAQFLSGLCENQDRSFLRFDYSGHGQSEGDFATLTLSDWLQDVRDIMAHTAIERPVLIGSSMGGWLSLLMVRHHPESITGLIGIAAAPDFTTWMQQAMSATQKDEMEKTGHILVPNDYGDPYIITKQLLEDGDTHLLLGKTLEYDGRVCLLQGKKDTDVPWKTVEKIEKILPHANVDIKYREEGSHSLSAPDDLDELAQCILIIDKA